MIRSLAVIAGSLALVSCGSDIPPAPRPAKIPMTTADLVSVDGTKTIGPGRTITVINVRDPVAPQMMVAARTCLLFENPDAGTAALTCF